MADYLSDTWSIMQAIRENLKDYRYYSERSQIGRGPDINWGLGFVQPKAVYPVINIFPIEKVFSNRRTGRTSVEYRLSIDVFSKMHPDMDKAKSYTLKVIDDIQDCMAGISTLYNNNKKRLAFNVQVTETAIAEEPLQSGHNFQSEGSVSVSIFGYEDFVREATSGKATKSQTSFNDLLNVAFETVQSKVSKTPSIRAWLTKVGKAIPLSPAVYVLNGDEVIDDEEFGGPTAELSKPITFTVLSFEFPRAAVLRNNIQISDNLVKVIEQNNRLGGYTDDGFVQNVVYGWGSQNDGFHFFSAVNAMYNVDKRFQRLIK